MSVYKLEWNYMQNKYDDQYLITVQLLGIPQTEYQKTIRTATQMVEEAYAPVRRFQMIFRLIALFSFLFLLLVSMVVAGTWMFIGKFPALLLTALMFAFSVHSFMMLLGGAIFQSKKKNAVALVTQQLQPFLESENTTRYYAKGVQFMLRFETSTFWNNKYYSQNVPSLEIFFAQSAQASYTKASAPTMQPMLAPEMQQAPQQQYYYKAQPQPQPAPAVPVMYATTPVINSERQPLYQQIQ